jgi:5'-nucleotidase
MPYRLDDKLVIGITSRALFDLAEADRLFRSKGLAEYRRYQREHENDILEPGTGFHLVGALLGINHGDDRLVEVVVISRNDADSGMRIFNSIEAHGLDISRAAFTDGSDPWNYLEPFHCDLFLSAERNDVEQALRIGRAAALVLAPPTGDRDPRIDEVRIAFDGDAVLFDAESEHVYQTQGLEAFQAREAALADVPMHPGPFEPFLMGLKRIQDRFPEEDSRIRLSLITARGAPAHKRVINTLRQWGVRIDETFFLGGFEKSGILEVLRPHIYFDDQLAHLEHTQGSTPAAQVVPVEQQMELDLGAPDIEGPKSDQAEQQEETAAGTITEAGAA